MLVEKELNLGKGVGETGVSPQWRQTALAGVGTARVRGGVRWPEPRQVLVLSRPP